MKALMVGMAGIVFLFSIVVSSEAQDCRSCARKSASVAACISCVRTVEGKRYSESEMKHWCGKNQPACYAGGKGAVR
jgi:hypothetical protein